jgi:hypothetical protein
MFNSKVLATGFWFFLLIFGVSGCTPHTLYRTDPQVCVSSDPEVDCPDSMLQQYANPSRPDADHLLGFIEFDDQGQLHDRKQMQAVVDRLYAESAERDLLMVVFVHGWKHSAAPGDDNIRTFRRSLERISEMESSISRRTESKARKVVGIYLGWRGGSVTTPAIKELTFWDRKNTAHKVGHGGVTEVLNRLELIRKTKASVISDPKGNRTRLIVVGHSFGGAIVFSALSQIMVNGFLHTAGPDGQISNVKGFGDLVVLINPAFEALRFAPLSDMANERRTYFQSQLPVIVVLTSEADYATRYAFPAGRWFSTFFEKHRHTTRKNSISGEQEAIDQRSANITAAGHFGPYRTHYLRAAEAHSPVGLDDQRSVENSVDMFFELSRRWENDEPGSVIDFGDSELERTANSAGRNPYLVIQVDKELIGDHNDIDDPRIANFVRQLILISSQSSDLEERKARRNFGN